MIRTHALRPLKGFNPSTGGRFSTCPPASGHLARLSGLSALKAPGCKSAGHTAAGCREAQSRARESCEGGEPTRVLKALAWCEPLCELPVIMLHEGGSHRKNRVLCLQSGKILNSRNHPTTTCRKERLASTTFDCRAPRGRGNGNPFAPLAETVGIHVVPLAGAGMETIRRDDWCYHRPGRAPRGAREWKHVREALQVVVQVSCPSRAREWKPGQAQRLSAPQGRAPRGRGNGNTVACRSLNSAHVVPLAGAGMEMKVGNVRQHYARYRTPRGRGNGNSQQLKRHLAGLVVPLAGTGMETAEQLEQVREAMVVSPRGRGNRNASTQP